MKKKIKHYQLRVISFLKKYQLARFVRPFVYTGVYFLLVLLLLRFHQFRLEYIYIEDTEIYDYYYSLDNEMQQLFRFVSDKINDNYLTYLIVKSSIDYELDPFFIYALIKTESGFDATKVTGLRNGSFNIGLCQLNSYNFYKYDITRLFNPETNLDLSLSSYLYNLKATNFNQTKALIQYKRGRSIIEDRKLGKSDLDYIQEVLNYQTGISNEFSTKYR